MVQQRLTCGRVHVWGGDGGAEPDGLGRVFVRRERSGGTVVRSVDRGHGIAHPGCFDQPSLEEVRDQLAVAVPATTPRHCRGVFLERLWDGYCCWVMQSEGGAGEDECGGSWTPAAGFRLGQRSGTGVYLFQHAFTSRYSQCS